MQKINETQDEARPRTPRRRVGIAALVAAAVLVLSTTAIAAVHYLNLNKVPEGETPTYTNEQGQEISYETAGTILTVPAVSEGSHDVCFQASYVPADAEKVEWIPYTDLLNCHAELEGRSVDALRAESGMTAEEADSWYTHAWYYDDGDFFRIDVYSGAVLDGTDFILDGTSTTVRETTIGGFEATFVTVDQRGTTLGKDMPYQNHIFLYSSELSCLVDVFGVCDFDELEKIVDGLTVRETELAAVDTFGEHEFSLIGGGVG